MNNVLQVARQLRAEGKFSESYQLVNSELGSSPEYASLIWQHQPLFWSNIHSGSCLLTRRHGADDGFLRALWSDLSFKQNFHRQAPDLPAGDELKRVLNLEFISLLSESKSIHWVIRDQKLRPWGLLSLTDISMQHRRGEVLIGLKEGAPIGLTIAAMLSLFQFFFGVINFQKIVALIYGDNPHALKVALKLGFTLEGHLKDHMQDPKSQTFVDLLQLGVFKENALSAGNTQLAMRLMKR
jgi:RimJ/RimL family protein N-acetyltransferase